jgi:hypothetical protein
MPPAVATATTSSAHWSSPVDAAVVAVAVSAQVRGYDADVSGQQRADVVPPSGVRRSAMDEDDAVPTYRAQAR